MFNEDLLSLVVFLYLGLTHYVYAIFLYYLANKVWSVPPLLLELALSRPSTPPPPRLRIKQ